MRKNLTKKKVKSKPKTMATPQELSDEDREKIINELEALISFRKAAPKFKPIIDFDSSSINKFF